VDILTTYRVAKRHVKGDAPEVPALSAEGVPKALTAFMGQALAKPDKA
jgi:hypothetical protein